jgi:transposase
MKQKSGPGRAPAEQVLKDIRSQTRRQYSAEEKIRIVLEGLRGEENISELCRREGIAASMYYGWSKEFLEAGKRRLAGDTARAATSGEVKDLRREATALKEVVAEARPADPKSTEDLPEHAAEYGAVALARVGPGRERSQRVKEHRQSRPGDVVLDGQHR